MDDALPDPPANGQTEPKLKIYFLPNLLTAANLFCGFVALTKIVEADVPLGDFSQIKIALAFILLACIFDLFDGRVARMGGVESPFGREFDSLADLISFGAAPGVPGASGGAEGPGPGPSGGRLVYRLDLPAVRRVPAGAVQLPGVHARAQLERVRRVPHPYGGGPGGVADAADDLVGREGLCHGLNGSIACRCCCCSCPG